MAVHEGMATLQRCELRRLVDDADPDLAHLDDTARGQRPPQLVVVHVSVHCLERAELAELPVDLGADEVAGMQDQVCRREPSQALRRELPRAPRHVRVGDDGDARQEARAGFFFGLAGVPTWKALPTKVELRARFISADRRTANT